MPYLFYIVLVIIGVILRAAAYGRGIGRFGYGYDEYSSGADIFSWGANLINRRNRRIAALKTAANYLKPYEKIFGSLTLSNKFVSLNRNKKGDEIICVSKEYDKDGKCMMFVAKRFSPMDVDEYFDLMCEMFNYNTRYTDVYNSLRANALISETVYASREVQIDTNFAVPQTPKSPVAKKFDAAAHNNSDKRDKKLNKEIKEFVKLTDGQTDVNNASEAELTALPGISIIVAKKIIKYRDTVRPFKSADDFIDVMNIKPHFANQLKTLICVNRVNMRKVKKAKAERIIDL